MDIVKIVEEIRRISARQVYKIEAVYKSEPSIFDSKFGGLPYWDISKEFPKGENGENMLLLAQINLSRMAPADGLLPREGMLQFFLASGSDIYGADFDEPDSQKDFRIIYHESIDQTMTAEQIKALGIPAMPEDGGWECFPVQKEMAVNIIPETQYANTEDYQFEEIFARAVENVTGEKMAEKSFFSYLTESDDRDYLYDQLSGEGHRIFGYGYFTQYDPRDNMSEEDAKYYDTLLFQMDSDGVGSKFHIIWGDCGVATFFMNSQALKNKDFSRVYYNWDCC